MTSEVSICNLALSHLGDDATVASIDPPEGSAQAEHCARFYPVARNALLEMHPWGFATKRVALAMLTSDTASWRYCYATPADALNLLAVLPADSESDYTNSFGVITNQPFCNELDASGNDVIYTNQESAVLRYTALVDDPTRFSPLFVLALSHHLASMLAGPLIKGDAGKAEAKAQLALMQGYLSQAKDSDMGQRRISMVHLPGAIAARG